MTTSYMIVDTLLIEAKKAADEIERLAIENDAMKASVQGVLSDGTPVDDVLEELKECKTDLKAALGLINRIKRIALSTDSKTAYAAVKNICYLLTSSSF